MVRARESRQWAVAWGKKHYEMRASTKMGSIYFISPVAYGMNPVFTVVGTFIFRIQHLGLGRSVVLMAAFLLPVTTLKKN